MTIKDEETPTKKRKHDPLLSKMENPVEKDIANNKVDSDQEEENDDDDDDDDDSLEIDEAEARKIRNKVIDEETKSKDKKIADSIVKKLFEEFWGDDPENKEDARYKNHAIQRSEDHLLHGILFNRGMNSGEGERVQNRIDCQLREDVRDAFVRAFHSARTQTA